MIDSEKPKWFDEWVDAEWNLKPNAPDWVKKEYELFNQDKNETVKELFEEAILDFEKKLKDIK